MECLVLETRVVGENDLLATLLTQDGRRISARAKGAREMHSRLRAGLLPCTVSDVKLIAGRNRWIAASATPLLTFGALQGVGPASSAAVLVTALLSRAAVELPDTRLFPEAVRLLRDINTAALIKEGDILLVRRVAAIWIKTLELLGFGPSVGQIRGLSDAGVRTLTAREIPKRLEDLKTLLTFLRHHSIYYIPEARGALRWAWVGLILPKRAESATIR